MSLPTMCSKIEILFNKYTDQPEVQNKMEEYMDKQFPRALELFVERITRKQNLEKCSQIYIYKFLNNPIQQYFYIQHQGLFIFYNGENYISISEDIIWHTLLSDISTREQLIPWKHKVKNIIIKKIKETSITSSIPESCTIQQVIQHLTPVLFRSKSEAKYFLTLLGDNILNKSSNKTHFSRVESKDFLTCLRDHIQCIFGPSCFPTNNIKYKYYTQDYKDCRIMSFNESVKIRSCWDSFIKSHILDIIAVASHYSNQFQNVDNYLTIHCQNTEEINSITRLSSTTSEKLIDHFVNTWLEPSSDCGEIEWVEMYYLWKSFIRSECNLPIMPIHIKHVKMALSSKIKYIESRDLYSMVTSSKLSYVKTFQEFWKETITEGDDEFEISELWSLYLIWMNDKNAKVTGINDEKMRFLVEHFAGSSVVGNFVTSVKCNLWDKQAEMDDIITQLKVDYDFCQEEDISIYKLYVDYCKRILEMTDKRTVSKKYFEKYIAKIIPSEYIKDNHLLKEYWTHF